PTAAFGRPKYGVFVKLNDSNRNWTWWPSHGMAKTRETITSRFLRPGPRMRLRPALPKTPGALGTTNSVLNQRSIERWLEGRFASATTSPRFTPPTLVLFTLMV